MLILLGHIETRGELFYTALTAMILNNFQHFTLR